MRASFRQPGRLALPALLLLTSLALAGCDSAEQRAEAHYQNGMKLLAAGDADRALIEFRNVFRLNGGYVPARVAYARIQRDRGETRDAMGQYLLVADQDPGNIEAQRAVTEIALQMQDFATAEEHADEAFVQAPADPEVRALKATVDFRHPETRGTALEMARGVVAEDPSIVAAQMVLIADRLNAGAPQEAMPLIDAALARTPGDQGLHLVRLAALEQTGDNAGTGAELKEMARLFPDDAGVRQALIQWYLRGKDPDGAEAVLRAAAARSPDDPQAALTLAQFLLEIRGPDAARAELQARIAAAMAAAPSDTAATPATPEAAPPDDARPFQRALAGLDFAQGRKDVGIAALRSLLQGAQPSDGTRDLQVALAGMLVETGGAAESAALIATVLEGDPNNVEALKLDARMAIDADQPDKAIQDMRLAQAQAPNDPALMTITAEAHERAGSRELAGEQLSRAVEVSGQGVGESLRYARFLLQDKRFGPAEGVVVGALRRAPDNHQLLLQLGQIHLARQDWTRAAQVAAILRKDDDPEAKTMATSLETASLRGQGRTEDAAAVLEGLAGLDGGPDGGSDGGTNSVNVRAMADLVRSYADAGDLDAAQRYLDGVLARDPASVPGRLLLAGLDQMRGDPAAAEAGYRAVIADAPTLPQGYQALYGFLAGQGRTDDAAAVLDAGLAAVPGNPALGFARAGLLEEKGDIDGAIAAYEALYAEDSASPVLANNLASLIASYRDDPASLDRAFAIARRLRGSDVPYFQDTYGWILHRRGDNDQALSYLAPAATALPDNALVQFHRAETELALGRRDEARASFARAVDAAAAGSPLPQIDAVRQRLAEIDAAPGPASAPDPDAGPAIKG